MTFFVPLWNIFAMTGNPLQCYLKKNGIRQEDFALRLRVSRPQLSKLMRGRRNADTPLLADIERETGGAVTAGQWVEWWKAQAADSTASHPSATSNDNARAGRAA